MMATDDRLKQILEAGVYGSIDPNELAAYADGRLDGADRARVEAQLRNSPEAQALYRKIRHLAAELAPPRHPPIKRLIVLVAEPSFALAAATQSFGGAYEFRSEDPDLLVRFRFRVTLPGSVPPKM